MTTTTPTPYLDPVNQAAINAIQAEGIPPLEDLSIPALRKLFSQLQEHVPIPGVIETHFEVPFEDGFVEVFLFKPEGSEGPLPTILYLHGGGWIFGDAKAYDSICRELVLGTGFALVFVQYSLAPEKKFPVQNEQCFAVAQYISKNGAKFGLKTDKIAVVGDSAGGQLAIAVALMALASKAKPAVNIVHQTLICPVGNTDFSKETLSEFEFFSGPLLDVPFLRKCARLEFPNPKDRQTPFASPNLLSKEQAAKMPPTTLVVDGVDQLRSDGLTLGEILQTAGVETVLLRGEGLFHDAYVFEATRKDPTCLAIVGLIVDRIKEALEPTTAPVKAEAGATTKATNGTTEKVRKKNKVEAEDVAEANGHKRKRTRRS